MIVSPRQRQAVSFCLSLDHSDETRESPSRVEKDPASNQEEEPEVVETWRVAKGLVGFSSTSRRKAI